MQYASSSPARSQVDFNILTEVETGDTLQTRFKTEGLIGITYLLGMIHHGLVTATKDFLTLLAVAESGYWDEDVNRYVTLEVTNAFDQNWFADRLRDHIDSLEIKSRRRPLVDTTALSQNETVFSFRFQPRDFNGLAELLVLNETGVITLDDYEKFERAFLIEDWEGHGRAGEFTSHLLSQDTMEYLEYFLDHVAPHLEMLRN